MRSKIQTELNWDKVAVFVAIASLIFLFEFFLAWISTSVSLRSIFIKIKVTLMTSHRRDGAKSTYYKLCALTYYIAHLNEQGDETDRNIEPNLITVP